MCDNLSMPAGSIRARVRAEMIAEIKAVARRHLETDGANLSLRAVARDMGMVSSALYRYFASRDDLLTALILDAYNALGEAAEAADAAVTDRSQLRARWLATARGIRGWALRTPAEYALLFGTPVPGYAAPADTITAAARTPVVLIRILADGFASGALAGESALRIGAPAGGPGALAAARPSQATAGSGHRRTTCRRGTSGPKPGPRRHRPGTARRADAGRDHRLDSAIRHGQLRTLRPVQQRDRGQG